MQYSPTNLSIPWVSIALAMILTGCGGSSSRGGTPSADSGSAEVLASVSLNADSSLVSPGASVVLSWSSAAVIECSASGGWSGAKPLTGNEVVGPINEDTSYTLSCSGDGTGAVSQVSVQVDASSSASVTLSASPEQIASGSTSTLSWDASGVDQCTASGGWSGDRETSGTFNVAPLTSDTSFQLTCDGQWGRALGLVTIRVIDGTLRWRAPIENEDGSPLTDLAGYTIYWGVNSRDYTGSHTINSPSATEWKVAAAPGDYYFALTAFDSEANESEYSNEVLKTIP